MENQIKKILLGIKNPQTGIDITSENRVSSFVIRDENIGFSIAAEPDRIGIWQDIENLCRKKISENFPHIKKITIILTHEKNSSENSKNNSENYQKRGRKKGEIVPQNIKNVILVAAGKGGVGKSTITVLLALALKNLGKKIAILDADIYGPSIPKILGIKKEPMIEDQKIIPHEIVGIENISIGYLLPDSSATAWRGAMVTKALHQLLFTTKWSERDFLIIDMPPGTGDVQISLAENCRIDSAVLVSTPQEIALLDVAKAFDMMEKLEIPVSGIIENMSYIEVNNEKFFPFGNKNVEKFAKQKNINFFGEIPINPDISKYSDAGKIEPLENIIRSNSSYNAIKKMAENLISVF